MPSAPSTASSGASRTGTPPEYHRQQQAITDFSRETGDSLRSAPQDKMQKTLPPRNEWVPRVFFREGMFYMIDLPKDDDLNAHAELNPGTLRIEDVWGNVLWPEGPKQ